MFDWFKKKDKQNNVVPFPEPKAVPKVEPPAEKEKPEITFYRLGITDGRRISFQMGYNEITMNARGAKDMIAQLQVFVDQIDTEEEDE